MIYFNILARRKPEDQSYRKQDPCYRVVWLRPYPNADLASIVSDYAKARAEGRIVKDPIFEMLEEIVTMSQIQSLNRGINLQPELAKIEDAIRKAAEYPEEFYLQFLQPNIPE